MPYCYLDLSHLNKNFKTANVVDTEYSMAWPECMCVFCQTSAGFLTGQLECLHVAVL